MRVTIFLWQIHLVLDTIFILYHEFWHWLVSLPFWIMGDITRPTLFIDRVPEIVMRKDKGPCVYTASMSIRFMACRNFLGRRAIAVAPIFGMIFLLIISPAYMWFGYIPYLHTMWLSDGDLKNLKA